MRIYPKVAIIVIIALLITTIPAPKAEAMEPISISLLIAALAPIVLPYVIKAMPVVFRGFKRMSLAMLDVGIKFSRMGFLLLGFAECTMGAPFGLFKPGLRNLLDGSIAPFQAMLSMFMIPFKTFGIVKI